MANSFLDRIETNPQVMLGKPVIKGTRITVEIILKKLSQNISFDEMRRCFSSNELSFSPIATLADNLYFTLGSKQDPQPFTA